MRNFVRLCSKELKKQSKTFISLGVLLSCCQLYSLWQVYAFNSLLVSAASPLMVLTAVPILILKLQNSPRSVSETSYSIQSELAQLISYFTVGILLLSTSTLVIYLNYIRFINSIFWNHLISLIPLFGLKQFHNNFWLNINITYISLLLTFTGIAFFIKNINLFFKKRRNLINLLLIFILSNIYITGTKFLGWVYFKITYGDELSVYFKEAAIIEPIFAIDFLTLSLEFYHLFRFWLLYNILIGLMFIKIGYSFYQKSSINQKVA